MSERRYTDSDGNQRVASETWGCNLFATAEDAYRSGMAFLRKKPIWVWRTTDGLYDWSAIPEPVVPWLIGAARVRNPARPLASLKELG